MDFSKFKPTKQCFKTLIIFLLIGLFWGYFYHNFLVSIPVSLVCGVIFAKRFRCGKK